MFNILVIAILGIVCTVLMVCLMKCWALRHGFLSMPSQRGSHVQPTPLGGGAAIALVSLGIAGLAVVLGVVRWALPVVVYLVAGGAIACMGFRDDRASLSAPFRLTIQAVCALAVVATGAFLPTIELPVLGVIVPGVILGALLAVAWMVWMTNAFNFIDGIDAMSGTQAIVAAFGWVLLFLNNGQDALLLIAGLLAAASSGFLLFNVTPSRIFMGDTGSTFLGFSFAALPLLAAVGRQDPRLLVVGVMFVMPALFDATLTLLRRLLNHQNLFEAHRTHFYQRLNRLGLSQMRVSLTYGAISLFSVGCGLLYHIQGATLLGTLAVLAPFAVMFTLAVSITAAEHSPRWLWLVGQWKRSQNVAIRPPEPNLESPHGGR